MYDDVSALCSLSPKEEFSENKTQSLFEHFPQLRWLLPG